MFFDNFFYKRLPALVSETHRERQTSLKSWYLDPYQCHPDGQITMIL